MYIEHDRDCKIFKDSLMVFGGGTCNCPARYVRAPSIMGPHEKYCPYLDQLAREVSHGICYCGSDPSHDEKCMDPTCPFWSRRSEDVRPDKVA
jgi:hypothetical protein